MAIHCVTSGCENPVENKDTGLCSSCSHTDRKAKRMRLKGKKVYIIPKVSKRQAVENRVYSELRKEHLKDHPFCQIRLLGCTVIATDVHHTQKRGKHLNAKETYLSACRHCHTELETKMSAKERRERGLLK